MPPGMDVSPKRSNFAVQNSSTMDHLPLNDIPMLVSSLNFLLRDEIFDSLDQICNCYNIEREELDSILEKGGYHYDEKNNHVV